VGLITSTFYQKREHAGTVEPVKRREATAEEHSLARTYSAVKELTV